MYISTNRRQLDFVAMTFVYEMSKRDADSDVSKTSRSRCWFDFKCIDEDIFQSYLVQTKSVLPKYNIFNITYVNECFKNSFQQTLRKCFKITQVSITMNVYSLDLNSNLSNADEELPSASDDVIDEAIGDVRDVDVSIHTTCFLGNGRSGSCMIICRDVCRKLTRCCRRHFALLFENQT
ncbi:hypothetical protein MAR_034113 [Mya arenaria]|uniref:Uncharacterized protein n=1 Tax=Mya arenaria TaxID=6604 RepID=A0ABY7GJI8_MYAAR|nr:hypothetical protein MAR_034113 [Mya arenaria]